MCTHRVKIFNKFAQRFVWVDCGVCPACLQQKANRRSMRIVNHEKTSGKIALFCTLTYANQFIPYIRPSELQRGCLYNIYRDYDVRFVRSDYTYKTVPKRVKLLSPIDKCLFNKSYSSFSFEDNRTDNLPLLHCRSGLGSDGIYRYKSVPDKVGVCYFKDWQDFYKRFDTNYFRNYGEHFPRSYYATSEYGETYCRPHFHFLIFIQPERQRFVEETIRRSWQYTGGKRYTVKIEVARSPARYVASYVNSGASFPRFLRTFHRPKNSYSAGFGMDCKYFALDYIISCIESGDFRYPVTRNLEGRSITEMLPIPRYVLSRWFPKFTGFCRLSSDQIYDVCHRPHILQVLAKTNGFRPDDAGKFALRLLGAKLRFRNFYADRFGDERINCLSKFDFARFYVNCWNRYASFSLRNLHEMFARGSFSWYDFYEDLDYRRKEYYEIYLGEKAPPDELDLSNSVSVDLPKGLKIHREFAPIKPVNESLFTKSLSLPYEQMYTKTLKQKKFTNHVMVSMGLQV